MMTFASAEKGHLTIEDDNTYLMEEYYDSDKWTIWYKVRAAWSHLGKVQSWSWAELKGWMIQS